MVICYNVTDVSTMNTFIITKQLHLQSFKNERGQFQISLRKEFIGVSTKEENDRLV